LKIRIKKVDNKLQYLRSAANKVGEQFEITTEARNLIKQNARRSEKLLTSIEKRAYNLAKSFEKQYNTAKTSPAGQEKYLNDVLEYIQGQRNYYLHYLKNYR
jgi:predicted HNH restriction endonuclease